MVAYLDKPSSVSSINGLVLLLHGLGGSTRRRGLTRMASALVQSNFAVLKLNLRGSDPCRDFVDGSNLQGLPTSQWDNVDVGLGYTSIYARGNVGVGTVDPRFTLQVGVCKSLYFLATTHECLHCFSSFCTCDFVSG